MPICRSKVATRMQSRQRLNDANMAPTTAMLAISQCEHRLIGKVVFETLATSQEMPGYPASNQASDGRRSHLLGKDLRLSRVGDATAKASEGCCRINGEGQKWNGCDASNYVERFSECCHCRFAGWHPMLTERRRFGERLRRLRIAIVRACGRCPHADEPLVR